MDSRPGYVQYIQGRLIRCNNHELAMEMGGEDGDDAVDEGGGEGGPAVGEVEEVLHCLEGALEGDEEYSYCI